MTKQEEKLFQEAKSHITQLCKIANEFEKLDLPFSVSISNRFDKSQTAIECLKDVVKKLYDEFENGTFITDEGKKYYGSYVKYFLILDFVIDKLKALGLEGNDIFVDNILKELEEV